MTTTKRTDAHRPSAIKPEDYKIIDGVGAYHYYWQGWSQCAHCGHALKYAVRFEYLPTGETLDIGQDCAMIIDPANTRIEYELIRLRNRIAKERADAKEQEEALERRIQFEMDHADVAEFLNEIDENEKSGFLVSMKNAYDKWGTLTERQLEATEKIMRVRQEQASRQLFEARQLANAPDAPEGRIQVEGEIVSTKWQHSDYGDTQKMLVKLDDGNKVFGTVPREVTDYVNGWGIHVNDDTTDRDYEGLRVRFTATFTRNEQHFSYYKRPAKAEVI